MKWLWGSFWAVWMMLLSLPAQAATIQAVATPLWVLQPSGNCVYSPVCDSSVYFSRMIAINGGDTIDFGSAYFSGELNRYSCPAPFQTSCFVSYGSAYAKFYTSPTYLDDPDIEPTWRTDLDIDSRISPAFGYCPKAGNVITCQLRYQHLLFTAPDVAYGVRLVIGGGPFTYIPQAPLPAGLPLLASALVVLGAGATWRRRAA